jgi:TRAP-type C4-dicarboxylate transport system permease small subunit
MERVVRWVERIAGASLAAVALLVFLSVALRDLFSVDVPDSFDFSRYLQGIAIVWGLAVATYRNRHITVDVVWEVAGSAGRRAIDMVASVVSLAFMAVFAYVLAERVPVVQRAHQLTADLKLPVWPFYVVLAIGAVAAAAVAAIRVVELVRGLPADHGTG